MNVTEIISQVLGRDDNVDDTGADNTERRKRHLEYLREIASELWWESDWSWKKKRATVTVPAALGYVALPPDFQSLGNYGGIYPDSSDDDQLDIVAESVIMALREAGYQTDRPTQCAIFGQGDFYQQYVQIPLSGSDVTLVVWYQPNQPIIDEVVGLTAKTDLAMTSVADNTGIITDAGSALSPFIGEKYVRISGFANSANNGEFEITGTVVAGSMSVYKTSGDDLVNESAGASVVLQGHVNDIKKIPEKYHQTVIMPGLRAKARESKGDKKWQTSLSEYKAGIKNMKKEEQRFQGQPRKLPSFFGRA